MTPNPLTQSTSVSHFGPKHILFAVLGLMTLFVIYNNERFIVDHSDPLWTQNCKCAIGFSGLNERVEDLSG
jgi:hypothetical protein